MINIKKWSNIMLMLFLVAELFITILFILSLPILFCNALFAQNLVNTDSLGQSNSTYGSFIAVKVLERDDIEGDRETGAKYAFCLTSKGMVIFDIVRRSLISFIPISGCKDMEAGSTNNSGAFYAYVARGEDGFIIINVDDPKKPYYEISFNTPGSGESLALEGEYAYVADGASGLHIIDMSDANSPQIVGTNDKTGNAIDVAIVGNYAYVAFMSDGTNGIHIIDTSDKNSPRIIGTCYTPDQVRNIAIEGDYAYMADGASGLHIIDMSDANSPQIVGTYDKTGNAVDVAIVGNYAYVVDGIGLQIIDITTKTNPRFVGLCDTPGYAGGIAVKGNYTYIADGIGLQIIDITHKAGPEFIGIYGTPWPANNIAIEGEYAYMTLAPDDPNESCSLLIIDISNKTDPNIVCIYNIPAPAKDMTIKEEYAYITNDIGLQTIDISDKSSPEHVSTYASPFPIIGSVAVKGEYAYMAFAPNDPNNPNESSGLLIIDISNKSDPNMISIYNIYDHALSVAIEEEYAYVPFYATDGRNELYVIDITDKTCPDFVGFHTTPGPALSVTIEGEYAYLTFYTTDGKAGLLIIDITNKINPNFVGTCSIPGFLLKDLAVKDQYAYVLDDMGLKIIDIGNKSSPDIIGTCDFPEFPSNMAINDEYAYINDGMGNLHIFNISRKFGPNIEWTLPVNILGEDAFEPDDNHNNILVDPNHFDPVYEIIADPLGSTSHTFFCPDYMPGEGCNDIDWVYFYAVEGGYYEIHASDISQYGYLIQLGLYTSDIMPFNDPNDGYIMGANNHFTFMCNESGYYLLEAKLGSGYPQEGVDYILSINRCYIYDDPGHIKGRVVDSQGVGINGLKIQVSLSSQTITIGMLDGGCLHGGGRYRLGFLSNQKSSDLEVYEVHTDDLLFGGKSLNSLLPPGSDIGSYKDTELPDIILTELHTIKLPLSKGMNLFYFPSIVDVPNIKIDCLDPTQFFCCRYDPISTTWEELRWNQFIGTPKRFKPNHFYAISSSEPGIIYIHLKPKNRKPVLYLKGFSGPDCSSPIFSSDGDIFDPDYFDPNVSTSMILNHPNLTKIQMISRQNPQNGRWESSYLFFGKPTGNHIDIKSDEFYIVTKSIDRMQ